MADASDLHSGLNGELQQREAAALRQRRDHIRAFFVGALGLIGVLLVIFSITLVIAESEKMLLGFQILHFMTSIAVVVLGGHVTLRMLADVRAADDTSLLRKQKFTALLSGFVLAATAVGDMIATVLQVVYHSATVSTTSIVEDIFTVPETFVMSALLVLSEWFPHLAFHHRREKMLVLPLIVCLNLSFAVLNVSGNDTWNDSIQNVPNLVSICQTIAIMFRGICMLISLDYMFVTLFDLLLNPTRNESPMYSGAPLRAGHSRPLAAQATPADEDDDVAVAILPNDKRTAIEEIDAMTASFQSRLPPLSSMLFHAIPAMVIALATATLIVARHATMYGEGNPPLAAASYTFLLIASVLLIGFITIVVYFAFKGYLRPRDVTPTLVANHPEREEVPTSSTLRLFIPGLLAVAWLFLNATDISHPFRKVVVSIAAWACLLQMSVVCYFITHGPIMLVLRPKTRCTDAIPPADPHLARTTHTLIRVISFVSMGFNAAVLLACVWPDNQGGDGEGIIIFACRGIGAAYHAYTFGAALHAHHLVELVSEDEAARRSVLLKSLDRIDFVVPPVPATPAAGLRSPALLTPDTTRSGSRFLDVQKQIQAVKSPEKSAATAISYESDLHDVALDDVVFDNANT